MMAMRYTGNFDTVILQLLVSQKIVV